MLLVCAVNDPFRLQRYHCWIHLQFLHSETICALPNQHNYMILFKIQILFMNSWLNIKYFNFLGWWDGKIFPWSRLKLRFWDVLGCLQYLLERLAITKYETSGALVDVTIEVVVPSDLSSKIYILCKVLLQDWIWVKWPSNSRLKSISIHTIFLCNGH